MKVHAIEGNRQHLDGGSMFGNAPKAMWQKWTQVDENNRIPLATRALLVQLDDGRKKRFGIEPDEDVLLRNLKKLGVEETDIDLVVLSHLHFDHAGGLLPEYGDDPPKLRFPNAMYYISEAHWQYAHNPHPRERASFIPLLHELLNSSDRLVLIDKPEHRDLNFGVRFHFSEGHTQGLMLSEIDTENGPLVFVTDLIPGNAWVHLPLTMGYDRFPELKVDEKQNLYESLEGQNARFFYTHDPKIVCASLMQDEEGRYFGEPVDFS